MVLFTTRLAGLIWEMWVSTASGCADGIVVELWKGVGSSHAPGYGDAFVDALVGSLLSQG